MAFFKALFPAFVLTWVVAAILGNNRSSGGQLYVHYLQYQEYGMYWSWPLFLCGTALAWFILKSME